MLHPEIIILILALASFFWGGFITPIAIGLANRFRILDAPGERKIHSTVTPRGAGVGLWLGYLVLCLYDVSLPFVPYFATAATLVFFSGYIDDMKSLPAAIRLMVHIFAAWLATFPIGFPPLLRVIIIIWIAGVTSAYNLIDGANGLCLSMFIASSSSLFIMGVMGLGVSTSAKVFGISLAMMALGTFCWNFPRAQTFLGDGGSTLLGFLFAAHAAEAFSTTITEIKLYEVLLLLAFFGGIPVFDTFVAFSRRLFKGKSPFSPDRGHLHHRLLDLKLRIFWTIFIMLVLHASLLFVGIQIYIRVR